MVNKSGAASTTSSLDNFPFVLEEQLLVSKTGRLEDCEDAISPGPHFVAVIDGATSKTGRRWNGETGGRVAARIISETFSQIPQHATFRQAFDRITSTMHEFYKTQGVLEAMTSDPLQRLMASVVALSFSRKEVWVVGDCQCLFSDRHLFEEKMGDKIAALARAMYLEIEIAKGTTIEELSQRDTGRAFILPLLEGQSQFQNNPAAGEYEYAVVDGFPIPDEKIVVQDIPSDTDAIVLASDGYPLLKENLEASEKALQEILHDDPLLFRQYKSTKGVQKGNISFDDRAYVKVNSRSRPNSKGPEE